MRALEVRAGERTRVLRRFSSSIPATYTFDVVCLDGSPVSGTVEIAGSRWLFAKDPVVVPLEATVTVAKGFWDTRYAVYVTPDRDVRITLR